MAINKVETIIDRVIALLTGLTTTAGNIERGRVHVIPDDVDEFLSVYRGGNVPADGDESITPAAYWWLTVSIDMHARPSDTQTADQRLSTIEQEVIVALMADLQLGLSMIVKQIGEGGASEPDIDGEGAETTAMMTKEFYIQYRRAYNDPGA